MKPSPDRSILNPARQYTPAVATDIAKTFAAARARIEADRNVAAYAAMVERTQAAADANKVQQIFAKRRT